MVRIKRVKLNRKRGKPSHARRCNASRLFTREKKKEMNAMNRSLNIKNTFLA